MIRKVAHYLVEALTWVGVLAAVFYSSVVETDSLIIRLSSAAAISLAGYWTIRAFRDRRESATEQKQIAFEAQETRFQKERWEAFLELSHDGIIILDKANHILKINDAVIDITGYARQELIGQEASVFHCEKYKESGLAFGLAFLTDANPTYYEEVSIRTRDGQPIDVGVRCSRAKKHPGHRGAHLILIRDLTKIHQAESLEHDFVSMTSHQLFTPLSIIRGHISMVLSGDLGKLTQKQKSFLEQSLNSTKKMVHLVTELLSISRLEEQKIVLNTVSTDVSSVIARQIDEMEPLAKMKEATVTFNKPKKAVPRIKADGEKLSQVIQNIVDNSIKYCETGGHIDVNLEVRAKDLLISITDDGIGIPETDLNKIFQRFYRSANAINKDSKGTGLGLYIARVIIERHYGKIWAESHEGEGATFFISLPR